MDRSVVALVFDTMCRIYATDYRIYDEAYDYAVDTMQKIPAEPCDQIRNAFDHFACASLEASTIVTVPEPNAALAAGGPGETLLNIERGRKHIAIATFYCHAHVVAHRMSQILRIIASLPAHKAGEIGNLRSEIERLDKQLQSLAHLPVERKPSFDLVTEDINNIELLIKDIGGIATAYDTLFRKACEISLA
jgi:hypothetical protein